MRSRAIAAAAFALLIAAFVTDAVTPQTLVVAILLDVPIVLAALTQSRSLTYALVLAALGADVAAALINAARDGYHWQAIGVGDRLLSMLSIVLVGYLSTAVQERAERVGRLAAQEARARREAALSAAAERVRASLSPELVARAIVREAVPLLGATAATWYPSAAGAETLTARAGVTDVEVVDERAAPEIVSLTHRVAGDGAAGVVRPVDPVGRFVLERLAARSAVAVPVAERGTAYGVLLASFDRDAPDDATVQLARGLAGVAVDALSQARLFGELAERNEALSERQDVIRDLVYALSHDLRTPLAALSMTLRQAAGGSYGALPDAYATVLRDSLVSVDDLARLADTLLLVARFESGDRSSEREPLDLAVVAREIASELHAMAEARGIALDAQAGGEAPVLGSRGDLKRAVANLTANALQHTPQGGRVELRATVERDVVRLSVSDDGYGIDERARATLFRRFSSTSRAGSGTGLGLYIVRRIAEENGGSVHYEAREPRGSVFTLSLPKARG
ncbi:MAG TPA: ATP-binding protein [Candidatus Elarobacter sp.]|nr:ATP-binding protein [Candidatus Elarobacter sp.]